MDQRSPRPQPGGKPKAQRKSNEPAIEALADTPVPDGPDEETWASMGRTRVLGAPAQPTDESAHLQQEDTAIVTTSRTGMDLSQLGEYQLKKKLGEGAMGAVYLARHAQADSDVALKVLFPHVAANPKLVERLYREGRTMGQLDHPNIVQGYGIGEHQGFHYVAIEYIDGDSLQKWINRMGRLDVADAVHIALKVASALGYAHDLGLVHRDIKPDNILLTRQGQVKVTDLGMVKLADEDMSLTQTGHAVGTPWYMPLEQARNAKDTDGRCDIYALGSMLYCMLTGKPPFPGSTIVEVIQAKEQGTFPPARQLNPDVPERLDLIIAKMTAKLPKYRYQTCAEVIKDLESLALASARPDFPSAAKPKKTTTGLKKNPKDLDATQSGMRIAADQWLVRVKTADGGALKKLNTAEVKRLLEEGLLDPTAKAARHEGDSFRALATYIEFQGSALSRVSKRAADAQGSKFRNLLKKIEEKDKARDEEDEKSKERQEVQPLEDYWHLWKPAALIGGGLLGLVFLWWLFKGLFSGN